MEIDISKQVAPSSVSDDAKRQKQRKKRILLMGVLLVLMSIGAGIYAWNRYTAYKEVKEGKVVIWNGRRIPVLPGSYDPPKNAEPPDFQQNANELETQISKGGATHSDYLALAQTYFRIGNKVKAIENYEKAIKAADPKMPNYNEFVTSMNNLIKSLKESP